MNTEEKQRNKIIEIAKQYINTPYHECGMIKGVGVDCGSFIACVFNEAGLIPKIQLGNYSVNVHLHKNDQTYFNLIKQYAKPVERETPLPGDLILYQVAKAINHCAIVLDYPNIIHAVQKVGVVFDNAEVLALKKRQKYIYSYW